MKTISAMEAVRMMETRTTHTIVSVSTVTDPKFLKKGRVTKAPFGFGDVKKFSDYLAMVGLDYEHVIRSRQERQGVSPDTYARGESWHIPYNNSRLIRQHRTTGELYFYVFLTAGNAHPVSRFVNVTIGREIPRDMLEEYLPVESKPKNQGLAEGTEIEVRTLKLDSLKKIAMDGETYVIA